MPVRIKLLLTLVLPLPLLCACGSSSTHTGISPFGLSKDRSNTRAALKAPSAADADMVAAVSQSGSDATIGLKFRLSGPPRVGTPVQIELALLPSPDSGITHIHASLQAGEGLQLQSQRTFDISAPQEGVALRQEVTVLPEHAGVLSLSATLLIDSDSGSMARTYAIPLIAADHAS